MHLKMPSVKWQLFCSDPNVLTCRLLETDGFIVTTVATDALVLEHQAISIHSAGQVIIVLNQFILNVTFTVTNTRNENYF